MIRKIVISKFFSGSFPHNRRAFQLCQKSAFKYYFSSNNPNPQKDPKQQQSQQPKPASRVSSIQRLKQLKQQKRQQQYQKKLQQINITTGSFNAFLSYLWLQKHKLFYIGLGVFLTLLFTHDDSPFCYKTMGVVKDPFTGKKKFMVVNEYREKTLEKTLIGIIQKQLDFWTEQNMKGDNSQVNKVLQKKLQTVLSNLSQKYGIQFKSFPRLQKPYQIAQSNQTLVLSIIGDDKLIVSTKLLKFPQQTLQALIMLMHSLHSRRLHTQNIAFWQRLNLKHSNQTSKIIKLEKTFISNVYNAQGIHETVDLISKRYAKSQEDQLLLKENIHKALKELFSVKSSSKALPGLDLRKRLKNVAQFF